MKAKKIMGIISNLIAVVLYAPLSLYTFGFGIVMLASGKPEDTFSWGVAEILAIVLTCIPIFCIIGLLSSIVLMVKKKYKAGYVMLLSPFAIVFFIGVFFVITWLFQISI